MRASPVIQLLVAFGVWSSLAPSLHAQDDEVMPASLPDEGTPRPESESGRSQLRFEVTAFGGVALRLPEETGQFSFGFGLTYGMGWGEIPLLLGLDFLSINTPQHTDDVLIAQPGSDGSVAARREARERVMHFDVWLRVQPPHWAIRPYVEGHFGAQLVQSQYGLVVGAGSSALKSEVVTDQAWVSSFGWGAGVDFWGLFNANRTVSLTLGVRQLFGGTAKLRRELPVGGESYTADHPYATSAIVVMLGAITVFDLAADPDPYAPRGIDAL